MGAADALAADPGLLDKPRYPKHPYHYLDIIKHVYHLIEFKWGREQKNDARDLREGVLRRSSVEKCESGSIEIP